MESYTIQVNPKGNPIESSGIQENHMESNRTLWNPIELSESLSGIHWNSKESYGIQMNLMEF